MHQLIKNIEQWAEDRNLINGSTPQKQMLKLMEEFGELCGGIARNNPEMIKDAIGDCFVVLVILSNQLHLSKCTLTKESEKLPNIVKEYDEHCATELSNKDLDKSVEKDKSLHSFILTSGRIASSLYDGYRCDDRIGLLVGSLYMVAYYSGLKFKDCVQHAYDQIKDRKGKMIDGVFVKDEDL